MKKIIMCLMILLLVGCGNKPTQIEEKDSLKFKEEYESLNNKKNSNDKEYVKVEINDDNPLVYATYDEVIDKIKNDTAVIYFGFPECPWCRNAIPVLIDATKELGIEKVYYYNALSIRDKKSLNENGEVVVEEEGTKEYKKLVELLYDYLPVYSGLNDGTVKRLYFPTVLFIKEGKVIGLHTSTLDSQNDPYVKLTTEQYEELKMIYQTFLNKTFDIACDEAC